MQIRGLTPERRIPDVSPRYVGTSRLSKLFLIAAATLPACDSGSGTTTPPSSTVPLDGVATAVSNGPSESTADTVLYTDPSQPIEVRTADLLSRLTLAEKIGQMTQADRSVIAPEDVRRLNIGSVLSGGGSAPAVNTAESWAAMVDEYQRAAMATRLGIPMLYGIDAVHGHGNVYGATIFPHNIGLGAANDASLVERIGRATAVEMAATGIRWNFAPVVAVPQDIRWGRTYEAYSEETRIVTTLATAYIQGLQSTSGQAPLDSPTDVLATPKHFIGDGGTTWGTSTNPDYQIDQGDTRVDEAELRDRHLPPYQAALAAGTEVIMVSFSSWNGTKMHANSYLLTDVLKRELSFDGFLLSDWAGIDQIPGDYASDIVTAVNAGIDMVMVPIEYETFINGLTAAVQAQQVSEARIDDAVRRILNVKFAMGLFESALSNPGLLSEVGSDSHRALAREAVQRSLVVLKNEGRTLPLDAQTPLIFVAGSGADDIGLQSGGWTISGQGQAGDITPGTTILDGIVETVGPQTRVEFDPLGRFDAAIDDRGDPAIADVAVVVLAEPPYAEGPGDRADLGLPAADRELLERVRTRATRLVVVLLSGRPLVVTDEISAWDAFVAAWLPGTEGDGVADVLFGEVPFTGRLPYSWPRWTSQLPFDRSESTSSGCDGPLFPSGFAWQEGDVPSDPLLCPAS